MSLLTFLLSSCSSQRDTHSPLSQDKGIKKKKVTLQTSLMSCKKEKKPTLVLSQLRVQLILLQVLFVIGTPEYPGQDASPTQAAVERHPTEPTFLSSLAQPRLWGAHIYKPSISTSYKRHRRTKGPEETPIL